MHVERRRSSGEEAANAVEHGLVALLATEAVAILGRASTHGSRKA